MDRRKELKNWYLTQYKPEMGILLLLCRATNKAYLTATTDLKGTTNGITFQLRLGSYPFKNLQNDWKRYGDEGFEVKTLAVLEYDSDESKTDYSDELALLLEDCAAQFEIAETF